MRMRKLIGVRSLVKRFTMTLSACVCMAATQLPAIAQQAPPTAAAPEPALQEIIVTGSRIAAPNEVSTSPIQVISSQYIEASGKSENSDLIKQPPQNFH